MSAKANYKALKKLAQRVAMKRRLRLLADAAVVFFNVRLEDLKSSSKMPLHAWPRKVCQTLAASRYSKTDVADFWDRDRSLIARSISSVKARMETEPSAKKEVDDFLEFATKYIRKEERDGGRFG